jgi:hypothetical protein
MVTKGKTKVCERRRRRERRCLSYLTVVDKNASCCKGNVIRTINVTTEHKHINTHNGGIDGVFEK